MEIDKTKLLFLLLTLIILLVGVMSTVSAEDELYGNGTVFLNNISNLQDNSVVTINSSAATYSGVQVISANNVTIEASGLVTFTALKHSYFKITGNNVTLQGIKFVNSFGASAITWTGVNGHINNCTFTGNKAMNGGAITWNGANGTIVNSTFTRNIATSNSGAINWNGANGHIDNCTFVENIATFNGGAITLNNINCTISNSIFNNCVASLGSAIYIKPMRKNGYTSLINNDFINYKSNKANVVNCAPNFNIIEGSGANINLEGSDATFNSPVTVKILNNETITTSRGQKNNLTAIITIDGENNTLMNVPFGFILTDGKVSSETPFINTLNEVKGILIPTTVNGNVYNATYTKNTFGKVVVSGVCDKCSNVVYETGILNIPKENTTLAINLTNITYGEVLNITVTVNPNATGNITIFINDREIETCEIKEGAVKLSINNLTAGNYTIMAKYSGDEKYLNTTYLTNFTVEKATPIINIIAEDVKEKKHAPVFITVTDQYGNPLSGNVTVTINGKTHNLNITNGTVCIDLQGLKHGNYAITAKFNGNENYSGAIGNGNIKIKKLTGWDKFTNWLFNTPGGNACLIIGVFVVGGLIIFRVGFSCVSGGFA